MLQSLGTSRPFESAESQRSSNPGTFTASLGERERRFHAREFTRDAETKRLPEQRRRTFLASDFGKQRGVLSDPKRFFEQSLQRLPVSPELVIESGVGIRNLHPRNGEPATFSDYDPADGSGGVTWALISHQPGPRGIGEIRSFQSRINGGIIAAVQWFTEPAAALRTLFNKIKTSSKHFPAIIKSF